MLDLESEMTKHIFRASALMDAVMARGQKMSVSPSVVRADLLTECIPYFSRMRELARDQFPKQTPFILTAVDEYEVAIRVLAGLGSGGITEDRRDGAGTCSECGTADHAFARVSDRSLRYLRQALHGGVSKARLVQGILYLGDLSRMPHPA